MKTIPLNTIFDPLITVLSNLSTGLSPIQPQVLEQNILRSNNSSEESASFS